MSNPKRTLDLSAVDVNRARVAVANEVEGAITAFENFTVWKWHPSLQLPADKDRPQQ